MVLGFKATAVSPAPSSFELPALGTDIGFGVAVGYSRRFPKMLHSLSRILRAPEKNLWV